MVESTRGTLFVVSTPIGNMGDFSFRGVEVLRDASVVLAEDTRTARKLLAHHSIEARILAYHEHNEARSIPGILDRIERGENVALISDAGTPLLSDPGERLVRAAVTAGVKVVPVPGASALLAALVISGLVAVPFTFRGFLPRKGGERQRELIAIAECDHTVVIYEAGNRVAATLVDLAAHCGGDREVVVARELTKLFEEAKRGTLAELGEYYNDTAPRGEVVLVLAGAPPAVRNDDELQKLASSLREQGLSSREVVTILVQEHGAPRNLAYKMAQQ